MAEPTHQPPDLTSLASRLASTAAGVLRNRAELLALEWEDEKARLVEMLVWGAGLVLLAIMALGLITATIILLCRPEARLFVTAGFALVYLIGAVVALFGLKSLLRNEPFPETMQQVKLDRTWLESLK